MSALPPKADMCSALGDVRFVPIADIARKLCFKTRDAGSAFSLRLAKGTVLRYIHGDESNPSRQCAVARTFGVVGLVCGCRWEHIGGEPIPAYGYVAIVGGVFVSLLVGGGLMALVFYSSRHGYDDLSGGDK